MVNHFHLIIYGHFAHLCECFLFFVSSWGLFTSIMIFETHCRSADEFILRRETRPHECSREPPVHTHMEWHPYITLPAQ